MFYHLALADQWAAAQKTGSYPWSTLNATITDVGFMHGSYDHAQLGKVYELFYAHLDHDLVLLDWDVPALIELGFDLRAEPADPHNLDVELFPHLYGGAPPCTAVCSVTPYPGS